jgi:hypothetical protein
MSANIALFHNLPILLPVKAKNYHTLPTRLLENSYNQQTEADG